jgi:hypothetical protein
MKVYRCETHDLTWSVGGGPREMLFWHFAGPKLKRGIRAGTWAAFGYLVALMHVAGSL